MFLVCFAAMVLVCVLQTSAENLFLLSEDLQLSVISEADIIHEPVTRATRKREK